MVYSFKVSLYYNKCGLVGCLKELLQAKETTHMAAGQAQIVR